MVQRRGALFDLRQHASRKRSQALPLIAPNAELRTFLRPAALGVEAKLAAEFQYCVLIRLHNQRDGPTLPPKKGEVIYQKGPEISLVILTAMKEPPGGPLPTMSVSIKMIVSSVSSPISQSCSWMMSIFL
jgi:hypothetical protein